MIKGAEIAAMRREHDLSQGALARQAGISQQHLSLIEKGSLHPRLETLKVLLECLGLELEVRVVDRKAVWERYNRWQEEHAETMSPGEALRQVSELEKAYRDSAVFHAEAEPFDEESGRIKSVRSLFKGIR